MVLFSVENCNISDYLDPRVLPLAAKFLAKSYVILKGCIYCEYIGD